MTNLILNKILLFLYPQKNDRDQSISNIPNRIFAFCKHRQYRNLTYILLDIVYHALSNTIFFPVSFAIWLTPYRFVYGTKFQQIGEIPLLDFLLRQNFLKKKQQKYVLFLNRGFHDNSYLLRLYREHLIVIENKLLFVFLAPLARCIMIREDVQKYDSFCNPCVNGAIFSEYNRKYKNCLVKMGKDESEKCKKELVSQGINTSNFICLHVRESGFKNNYYSDLNRTTRNADIKTYDLMIGHFVKAGYQVVRLGDSSMVQSDFEMKYPGFFFEYSHSKSKSEEMDVFLISNCKFLVACSSGPSDVSSILNTNTLLVNGYPAVNCLRYLDGDLSIFKKLRHIKTGEYLPLTRYFSAPFDVPMQRKELNEIGYDLIDNSRDELLEAAVEFLSTEREEFAIDGQSVDSLLLEYHFGVNASGRFSSKFLAHYHSESQSRCI